MDESGIDAALIERWALHYLGRFSSSAENLRRVLLRRVRKRLVEDREAAAAAARIVDALVDRYRKTGLVDDAAYAAGRARARLRRGQSLRTIRAGLAARGRRRGRRRGNRHAARGGRRPRPRRRNRLRPPPPVRAVSPRFRGRGPRQDARRLRPRRLRPQRRRGGALFLRRRPDEGRG